MNTQCGTARWHLFLRLSIFFFEEWWSFRFARRYKIRCLDRFSKLDERSSSYFFFSDEENIFREIREIVFQDDTCFVELESGLKEREIFVSIFFLGGEGVMKLLRKSGDDNLIEQRPRQKEEEEQGMDG